MTDNSSVQKETGLGQRKVALTAGFGLLAMAIVAAFANFGVLGNLVVSDDATQTVANLNGSKGFFIGGIAGFVVIFFLDLLVAWMLFRFFKPVQKVLSAAMAWSRVIYAGFLGFSIAYLITALKGLGSEIVSPHSILESVTRFNEVWSNGLVFFGIHLLLLAYLIIRSANIPKWIGLLVAIAGLGYLIDSVGALVSSNYSLEIGLYTFIGELIFMFWLLFKGGR